MFVYTPGRFAGNLFFSSASALTGPLPHPNVFGGLRPESSSKEAPAGITVTNVVEPPAPVPPAENFPVEEMIYLV
ncbi:MAG: hypothetical protein FWF54_00640, partial [Candidatus Azobacteroides sp.]|nr:hypothetical protein [Candidatus Azobacteroides sp.]